MNRSANFVKTTLIGGFIFLLPFVLVIAIVGKAIKIVRVGTDPIFHLLPVETIAGIRLVNILAFLLVLLICFIAGLIAKSRAGRRSFGWLDTTLLTFLPGYYFFKAFTGNFDSDDKHKHLNPVLVRLEDISQIGFEIEKLSNGRVVVFIPESPGNMSGSVVYINEDRVDNLDMDFTTAFRLLRVLGKGSDKYTTINKKSFS